MQIASGIVTFLNLALSLVLGIRLLRQFVQQRASHELYLALYFLLAAFASAFLQVLAYGSLIDPRLDWAIPHRAMILGVGMLSMQLGVAGAYLFVWSTFRPDARWSRLLVIVGIGCMGVGLAWEGLFEGFEIRLMAGPGHWLGWAGRTLAFVWMPYESFRYWRLMRRRVRLGLADPVLANRFLLWSIFGVGAFIAFAADLFARVTYLAIAGTPALVMEIIEPVVRVTVSVTMISNIVSAAALFLTFFPLAGYRRWVIARSPLSDGQEA